MMNSGEKSNVLTKLTENREKPLRVAAFFNIEWDANESWLQLTMKHHLTLFGTSQNWTLVGYYGGYEYIEPTDIFNGGLPQMLSDCKDGKIDLIIIKCVSSLDQNIIKCISIIKELQQLKPPVGIYFEEFNLYTLHEDFYRFISAFSAIAQQESEDKGKRIGCRLQPYSLNKNPLKYTEKSRLKFLNHRRNNSES